MLQVLGRNRVIVLLSLVVINSATGYGLYQYLMPERVIADSALSGARAKLEAKREEVQKLKEEYAVLQLNLKKFKELEARGFFNNQNRVEAKAGFERLRTVSGILNARYDISEGKLVEDARASEAGYVIVQSPIVVDLDGLDDVDVYSFLKLIQERFPGRVDVTKMTINKLKDVSILALREIGTGKPLSMVDSKIEFVWSTMAKQDTLMEMPGASRSTATTISAPVSAASPEAKVAP